MKNNKNQIDKVNDMLGKIPPQAIDVEEAVLGALMLERHALEVVSGIIDAHSFYKESHQKLFETIKAVAAKKRPIDLLTVTMELKDSGLLEELGGPGYITQLTRRVASAAHIETHAKIIAEKYYLREAIRVGSEIVNLSYADEDVENVGTFLKSSVDRLEDMFTVADTGSIIKNVLIQTVQDIEKDASRANKNKTPGIPTGFNKLDVNTGGWRDEDLTVLAARPGVGKTSLALHFALEAANAGYWVNIFSLEMNKEALCKIMIASISGVYRSNIRDGFLKPQDWNKINQAVAKLENLPIIFRDAAGMNINQIDATIRKNRKNGKCDFAIIDYLQLVRSSQPKVIRELEVAEISRMLKTLTLDLKIPIMALSQLNREAENGTPKLSHLRESGAIEQDANNVIFLCREDDKIRFTIAKYRNGDVGEIYIHPNKEMTKFSESPIHEFQNNEQDIY